jgi:ATP-dependent DNA helicase DinG
LTSSPVIPLVTSTRDNCLGSFAKFRLSFRLGAALEADSGGQSFVCDLAVRESGIAELLPSVRTVILMRHQFNETGVNFWASS